MISFGKWPRVLFASVLAMALWTFISVNTNIFSVDGKFDGFMYFASYILVIGVWALVAVKSNFDIHICSDTVFLYAGGNDIVGGGRVFVWNILYKYYVLCRDYGDNFCDYKKYEMDGNSNKSRCVLIQLVQLRCKYFKRYTANSKRLPCNRYGGTGSGELHISTEIPDCCCNGYSWL